MKLAHQVQRNLLQLFNQNPLMAIRRISDNMMLNANNSLEFWLFFKEEVIGKQPELKLFTEQENIGLTI
jgi:hypothetical protein